jgi:acetoin utilization protein AcuB
MFLIRSVDRVQRPYAPRTLRTVSPTSAIDATAPIIGEREQSEEIQERNHPAARALKRYLEGELRNEREEITLVQHIMSSPVFSLIEDSSISELEQAFRTHRFRHIPIIAADQSIVGIISDRLLLRLKVEGIGSFSADSVDTVSQIMVKEVLTATPDTSIKHAARVLFEERIGSLPITTAEGVVLGMITRSDILRALITSQPFQLWA